MTAAKEGFLFLLTFFLAATIFLPPQMASAETKTSAPQFAVRYIDNSYDVPLITKIVTNPYTGEPQTVTEGGNHVDNRTIEITIANPSTISDRTWFHYNLRVKGHYSSEWTTLFGANDSYAPQMSDSEYTTLTFFGSGADGFFGPEGAKIPAPMGGVVDFQVAVLERSVVTYGDAHVQFGWGYKYIYTQISDWSSTQTVTIGDSQPTQNRVVPSVPAQTPSTQNPTSIVPSTAQPNNENGFLVGLGWERIAIIVLAVFVGVLVVLVGVLFRKVSKKSG
ncbi:MAG: hypothetical protein NWE96_00650 [Candidatus Bathyarchaeota archaeon]|nr:hypothetical protein [Candidatus Bathyarchaeota archaeon]